MKYNWQNHLKKLSKEIQILFRRRSATGDKIVWNWWKQIEKLKKGKS